MRSCPQGKAFCFPSCSYSSAEQRKHLLYRCSSCYRSAHTHILTHLQPYWVCQRESITQSTRSLMLTAIQKHKNNPPHTQAHTHIHIYVYICLHLHPHPVTTTIVCLLLTIKTVSLINQSYSLLFLKSEIQI